MIFDLSTITALLLSGLVTASTLFIVASGLSIIFGVTRVVNFAHGSFYMLGCYATYSLVRLFPQTLEGFCAGVLVAVVAVGAIGFVVEALVLRHIYKAPHLLQLLATYGVVLMVQDAVRALWGPEDLVGTWAPGVSTPVVILGNYIPAYNLFILGLGPVLFGGLWLLFHRTRWGVLIRAATEDREMVGSLGVNQRWLFTSVFCLGVALAAFGGALEAPRGGATTQMDLSVIAEAFVVVVVGGMGSVTGALAASLLIGLLEAFGLLFLPKLTLVFVFILMAIVLIIRPQGLAGRREIVGRDGDGIALFGTPLLSQRATLIVQAAILVVLAVLPLLFGEYVAVVVIELLVFMTFASSLYLLVATGGLLSFGHAAYFGLGAYAAGVLSKHLGVPMLPALLAAPVVAGLGAMVFGYICVRLDGVYRAMLTLAVAQITWSVAFQWYSLTGGDNGLMGVWPAAWAASSGIYVYLVLAVSATLVLSLTWIAGAPFGYGLRGARDSSLRAMAIGIDVRRLHWLAFSLAGAVAGLAGGLFAFARGGVVPDMISIDTSVDGLVMVLLGGLGSWVGPLIGAVLYKGLLAELIRITPFWRGAIGIFVIFLAIAAPHGVVGLVRLWRRRAPAVA